MKSELNQQNKQLVWSFWQTLEDAGNAESAGIAHQYLSQDHAWHGPDPINELTGPDAFLSDFWQPLLYSFPDMKRQTHIFMGGKSSGRVDGSNDGRMWVGATGVFNATFTNDYLTIPASKEAVSLRWGEFYRIEEDRIVKNGDVRYFDHPKFGVVVKVTRVEAIAAPETDDDVLLPPLGSAGQ